MVCPEGHLPFITFLDFHIIVSPSYIQFRKVLGLHASNLIYDVWDKGKQIGVLHHYCVELSVVLNEPEFAIFFIDEEDRGCHWGLGGADLTGL